MRAENNKSVELLLEENADVNTKLQDGKTILMVVAENGDLKHTKKIIERGADINAKGKKG